MNRGISVKYRVHINMSETYSMGIFSFVPMFEKKKVLLGAKSHFWQVSKWPKSTKESFFFKSIPTLQSSISAFLNREKVHCTHIFKPELFDGNR